MVSGMERDLRVLMDEGDGFPMEGLREKLLKRGYRGFKISGVRTGRGYYISLEAGEDVFDITLEGEMIFRITEIFKRKAGLV